MAPVFFAVIDCITAETSDKVSYLYSPYASPQISTRSTPVMNTTRVSEPGKPEATSLMQQGQIVEARRMLQKVCQQSPNDAEALYLLGSCHGMLGSYQDAVKALQHSLQLQPAVMQIRYALGGALKMLGRTEEACEQFLIILNSSPDNVDTRMALADTLVTRGEFKKAHQHLQEIEKLLPGTAKPQLMLGTLAEQVGNYEEALIHFRKAVQCQPQSPVCLCAAGRVLSRLGRWNEARSMFRKALKHSPEYPDALGGLAWIYDRHGQYEKVACQVEPLLKRRVYSLPAAMAFINVCKHLGRCDEAVGYAEELLQNLHTLSPSAQSDLHLATAKALDNLGRYDEAFGHFKAGNEAVRLSYEPAGHHLWISTLIEVFSPATLLRMPRAQVNSKRAVFVVGMPRSGTSLIEQILSSHPQVAGGGELTDLTDLTKTLPDELGTSRGWPHCVNDLTQYSMDRLARRYLDRLRGVSKKALRVTDKMPQNYYLIGLIELLFPQSRIIHCKRDPLDTCLSIYFQNFLDSHSYARDLFNIGTHYHQYLRLMAHWRQTLTIPILDILYEDLVYRPETTMRQMLEFCGLEWNSNCLSFHKLERMVSTASYDQVRQPLHTSSVQRWRNYESYLGALKDGLKRGY